MGKRGPCCHCGVTSTPLWRNGPPEKPVLCNACGSRWRTKGSLTNYTPIHARAFSPLDFGDSENSREDITPSTKSKGWYTKVSNKRKMEDGYSFTAYQPYRTCFEDDTSNKSSSGSAISVSEGCVQVGSTDINENSGSFQTRVRDFQIPSKKRTRIRRDGSSSIEKLRQDLVSILQQQGSSNLSEFSEDVLLFEGEEMSFNSEIGHGSVLLKPPISTREEESEASSHVIGHKVSHLSETYMGLSCCSVQSHNSETSSRQLGKEQVTQDKWETYELEDNPVKHCASTNKTTEGPLSGDPDILQSKYSSQRSKNEKPSGNKSLSKSGKEVSSLASDVAGSRISGLTKRPRESPHSYTCEGKSAVIASRFRSPSEQSHVKMLSSGNDNVRIHAPSSGTRSLSPLSEFFNSDTSSSMNTVQLELP